MRLATLTILALAPALTAGAAVHHVDIDAAPGGDGTSWASAWRTLSAALDVAAAGDEVWVAEGVYTPAGPGGDRSDSFDIASGVAVYGGFAGDEDQLFERDVVANETVLSGDLDGNDGPDFTGRDDNARTVVTMRSGAIGARLDGFTVRGGHADGPGYSATGWGGGLRIDAGMTVAASCTFIDNWARNGAGLYAQGGSVTVTGCGFRDNFADAHGAGARFETTSPSSCPARAFDDNFADVGAGLSADGAAAVTVAGTRFQGNDTGNEGGGGAGIFVFELGTLQVTGCEFIDNHATTDGGGLVGSAGASTFTACVFRENTAGFLGGGLALLGELTIVNCVFSRNDAVTYGGGVYAHDHLLMVNCTLSGNEGGGVTMWTAGADYRIDNSIVWGNAPYQVGSSTGALPPSLVVQHSDVQTDDGVPLSGPGNIADDPIFVQPGADNVRLSHGSPALDAGSNALVPPGVTTDLDGNPRIQNGVVDMGAYEGSFAPGPPVDYAGDLDPGDGVLLVPSGVAFNPLNAAVVFGRNDGAESDETMLAGSLGADAPPALVGYAALAETLFVETTIGAGTLFSTVMIPFSEDDLDAADPLAMDVTVLVPEADSRALAVSQNMQPAAGGGGPIGTRHVSTSGAWGMNDVLGDYGVFWNESTGRGFAWANVDYAAVLGAGVPTCAADNAQPPDGRVGIADILAVILDWNDGPGPTDVDGDGQVGTGDILAVLQAWGMCP